MRVVVALGGNALLRRGEPLTAENQRANARVACKALAPLALEHELVISHGNGPQVGLLALQGSAYTEVEPYPLDVLGAQTEGMIGYLIQQELGNELPFEKRLASLLTLIEVDRDDPAFGDPTKPIGPIYDAGGVAAARGTRRAGRSSPTATASAASSRRRCRSGSSGSSRSSGSSSGAASSSAPAAAASRSCTRTSRPRRAAARRRRGGDRQGPRERAARPGPATRTRSRSSPTSTPSTTAGGRRSSVRSAARRRKLSPTRSSRPARWGRRSRPRARSSSETGGLAVIGSIADTPALLRGEAGTVVTRDADGLEFADVA